MALRASKSLKNNVGFYPASGAVFSNIGEALKTLVAQGFFRTAQSEILPWSLVPPVENTALEVMLWGCKKHLPQSGHISLPVDGADCYLR